MVYRGPSEGCRPCRKRKVKCPKEKPFCRHCVRRQTTHSCVYDNPDTSTTSQQVVVLTPQSSHSSQSSYFFDGESPVSTFEIFPPLSVDQSDQALCFFNAFYVRGPREPRTNIWAEEIMPRISKLAADSVLTLSSTAVATQVLNKERGGAINTIIALRSYQQAVTILRSMLNSDIESNYDKILPGIFMLEIFETISNIAGESEYTAIHQNAGMRTVQRAMDLNLKVGHTTKKIASALQSRYVWQCFATGLPASLFAFEDRSYPGCCGELDIYGAEICNILYDRDLLLVTSSASSPQMQTPPPESDLESTAPISALLLRTIKLLDDLKSYHDNLPLSWRPQRVSVNSPDFHPSIRNAGVYRSLCDVYSSLPTSHASCVYRVVRIAALQTRWLLEQRLATLSAAGPVLFDPNADTYDTDADALGYGFDCQPEIQTLVDDICAAVPFHLGNRGGPPTLSDKSDYSAGGRRGDHIGKDVQHNRSLLESHDGAAHFPPASVRLRNLAHFVDEHGNTATMDDAAHSTEAHTKGGFMILVPLSLLLGVFARGAPFAAALQSQHQSNPFVLREGQMEWIQRQIARTVSVQIRPRSG